MEGTSWVWVFLLAASSPPGPTSGSLEEWRVTKVSVHLHSLLTDPDVGGLRATISCKKSSYIDF